MNAWVEASLEMPFTALFGDRVVACRTDRPRNFHAMLAEAAARNPAGDALVFGRYRASWQTLAETVARVAAGLADHGITKGDRVALLIGNRPEFVIAIYALSSLGAVVVPISVREQAPGITHALDHSGARMLMFDPVFEAQLPNAASLKSEVSLIPTADADVPWGNLRSSGAAPVVDVEETDVAAILYTSGTTGKPKGAMIAHINLVHAAMVYEQVMQLTTGERSVVAVPMTHVTGLTAQIAAMARCAGALIIVPEFKAETFVALAAAEAMTHSVLVPAMYNLILIRSDLAAYDLSRWRIGGFGGAPMPAPTIESLARSLPSLGLMNLYGATETSCAMLVMPSREIMARTEQVGRAAPGADVLIMNDAGVECPAGEEGEIWLRGATIIPGYWEDEAASRAAFVGGFWRSGDVGRMDEEGFVSILDRIKDMIVRGGFKIYSAEVESVLAEHPAVLESAIVGRPCPVLGERVHAFVATHGEHVDAESLGRFCAERLADYKCPETFTIQDQPLPRNLNGKLLKREMRASLVSPA
jgi:acyl-CoA synthetase (AMP-forming)/AMP-acid ligase II